MSNDITEMTESMTAIKTAQFLEAVDELTRAGFDVEQVDGEYIRVYLTLEELGWKAITRMIRVGERDLSDEIRYLLEYCKGKVKKHMEWLDSPPVTVPSIVEYKFTECGVMTYAIRKLENVLPRIEKIYER